VSAPTTDAAAADARRARTRRLALLLALAAAAVYLGFIALQIVRAGR
jgi:hypothetical protein